MGDNFRGEGFDAVPVPPRRVLFLGDSIIAGGLWGDLFPDLATTTRGIGGDTVQGLAARLDGVLSAPIAVNVMIGTNDLHGLRDRHDTAAIADRAEDLFRRIRAAAPEALLLVNSVLLRTELFAPRIRALNQRHAEIADRQGATYVDLWPVFAEPAAAAPPRPRALPCTGPGPRLLRHRRASRRRDVGYVTDAVLRAALRFGRASQDVRPRPTAPRCPGRLSPRPAAR